MTDLEETQEVPQLVAMPSGVFMVVRFWHFRCDGTAYLGPPLPPAAWFNCALNGFRWEFNTPTGEPTSYRKRCPAGPAACR